MKRILAILAVATFVVKLSAADTNAPAPQKIGAAEAAQHYGQTMIVTGKVAQVTIRPTVTFLNLDKAYPDSPFTAVIFHGHSSFYGNVNALRGKTVEIKGKIRNYRDKPEIVLDRTNQLTVFDAKGVNITANVLQVTNRVPLKARSPAATPAAPANTVTNFPEIM